MISRFWKEWKGGLQKQRNRSVLLGRNCFEEKLFSWIQFKTICSNNEDVSYIYFFLKKKKVISFLPSSHKLISFYHGKCIKWLPINSCPSLILQEKQQKPTQISPGDFAISDLCYSYFHKTMGGIYLFQFGSPKPKVQTMNHVGQCPSPLLSLLRSALAVGVSRS